MSQLLAVDNIDLQHIHWAQQECRTLYCFIVPLKPGHTWDIDNKVKSSYLKTIHATSSLGRMGKKQNISGVWEHFRLEGLKYCCMLMHAAAREYLTYALKLLLRPILVKNLNRWISCARLDHKFYLNKYGSYWVFTNKIAAQVSKSNESTCNLLRVKIAL